MTAPERVVEVSADRFPGWLARFESNNPAGPTHLVAVDWFRHDPLGIILVRRGGYAVGLAHGDRLTAHKVGTRYVQSRTAAGGWSQQRFARRRANQADGLVGAVAEHAVRLLGAPGVSQTPEVSSSGVVGAQGVSQTPEVSSSGVVGARGVAQPRGGAARGGGGAPGVAPRGAGGEPGLVGEWAAYGPGLVVGGDRRLVAAVLEDPRLRGWAAVDLREYFDIVDPNRGVLDTILKRARCARITLRDDVARAH